MNKVGIITFHRAENFGAVMQTYALQEVIRSMNAEAYVIDHRNLNIEAEYQIFNPMILFTRKNIWVSLRKYLHRFRTLKSRQIKKRGYVHFRNSYLNVVPESEWRTCNVLVTGSDQVWNLHLTGGFDCFYFLKLPKVALQGRISYAASSDRDPQNLLHRNSAGIREALAGLNRISVREDFLKEQLLQYTEKDIEVLPDPTLLLDVKGFDRIAVKPCENGYVCVYHMTPSDEARKLAERIASARGLQVVELFGGYDTPRTDNICKTNLSPEELLGYLKYADEIVTTSFHGIAFSIKFRKNFWVIDRGDNFRQKNILEKSGLRNRLVSDAQELNINEPIDYNKVEEKVDSLISSALDYLRKALR